MSYLVYNGKLVSTGSSFDDWFLPSGNELLEMETNLQGEGVGGFSFGAYYHSSSQQNTTDSLSVQMGIPTGLLDTAKTQAERIRPARKFTAGGGAYVLRDVGPAGGLIFYIDGGTTYYEAAPADLPGPTYVWSNPVDNVAGTSIAIGAGQANTDLIVAKGYTSSAADECNDYVLSSGFSYVVGVLPPVVGGIIEFLDGGGTVIFGSQPDIAGSKTFKANIYIDSSTSSLYFYSKGVAATDFLVVSYDDAPDWAGTDPVLMVHVKNAAGPPGIVRQAYDISNYLGQIELLEIVKVTGGITSVTIGGDTLTKIGDGYFDYGGDLKQVAGIRSSIWDVEIVGSHKWVGYPDGNQDSAWIDTIGSNDGVVGGSVSTRNLF